MEAKDPRTDLYQAVHACLLALLGRDGVVGVVLVDRDGGLILHEGPEPHGDVTALAAARHAAARTVDALLGPDASVRACLLTDARHGVYVAPAARGASVLIYLDDTLPAGLAPRLLGPDVRRLASLLSADGESAG